jgi:hypothetical protein
VNTTDRTPDIDYAALANVLRDFENATDGDVARAVVAAYRAQMRDRGMLAVRADELEGALLYVEKYRNLARNEPFPHADRVIAALRDALLSYSAS